MVVVVVAPLPLMAPVCLVAPPVSSPGALASVVWGPHAGGRGGQVELPELLLPSDLGAR